MRVHAAAINPLDWHEMRGTPYVMRLGSGLRKPKDIRVGVDYAGTVEAVGRNVTRFKPGDEVFGGRSGALAEYVVVAAGPRGRAQARQRELRAGGRRRRSPAPPRCRPCATRARCSPDEKVLVNGASGGVGTFAVQIAKSWARRSRASAARATSSWCARSAPITSSTTRGRITRRARSATT